MHASPTADLEDSRGDVDAYNLVPLLLQVQRKTACANAGIQDTTPHKCHRIFHMIGPLVIGRELHRQIVSGCRKAIVPLDDLYVFYAC